MVKWSKKAPASINTVFPDTAALPALDVTPASPMSTMTVTPVVEASWASDGTPVSPKPYETALLAAVAPVDAPASPTLVETTLLAVAVLQALVSAPSSHTLVESIPPAVAMPAVVYVPASSLFPLSPSEEEDARVAPAFEKGMVLYHSKNDILYTVSGCTKYSKFTSTCSKIDKLTTVWTIMHM